MIWIDSSFAVEWLMGTSRAGGVKLPRESLAILPMQYMEILTFFGKKISDLTLILDQLESLTLETPQKHDLSVGANLYLKARAQGSKGSLADALLAAVAQRRSESVVSFDNDFADFGFQQNQGIWRFE